MRPNKSRPHGSASIFQWYKMNH